jgi:shikimate kinase
MNITLIGNPGSGKSYIGKILAKNLTYDFVDIDITIEEKYNNTLQNIVDMLGEKGFLEEESNQTLSVTGDKNTIISPGGSIVYSEAAMIHLKNISKIVYLDTPFQSVVSRIDIKNRGIVGLGKKSFKEIFLERDMLYRKYADIIIQGEVDADIIVENIKQQLSRDLVFK